MQTLSFSTDRGLSRSVDLCPGDTIYDSCSEKRTVDRPSTGRTLLKTLLKGCPIPPNERTSKMKGPEAWILCPSLVYEYEVNLSQNVTIVAKIANIPKKIAFWANYRDKSFNISRRTLDDNGVDDAR